MSDIEATVAEAHRAFRWLSSVAAAPDPRPEMRARILARALALDAGPGVCPACLEPYTKRRPWQKFCCTACKRRWDKLLRRIGDGIAAEIKRFYGMEPAP